MLVHPRYIIGYGFIFNEIRSSQAYNSATISNKNSNASTTHRHAQCEAVGNYQVVNPTSGCGDGEFFAISSRGPGCNCRLQGSKRDAILYAVGANADNGLRRSNLDKRNAVMKLLNDAEWAKWSDREIARQCKVSHMTATRLRPEPICNIVTDTPRTVIRNGSTYEMRTGNIGKTIEPEPVHRSPITNYSQNSYPQGRLGRIPTKQVVGFNPRVAPSGHE